MSYRGTTVLEVKASPAVWASLLEQYGKPYFRPDEPGLEGPAFARPYDLDADLLERLWALRHYLGRPINVVRTYGDRPGSQHHPDADGVIRAADIYSRYDASFTLYDFYAAAERFCPSGLGAYPYRNTVHFDTRILAPGQPAARWWFDRKGKEQPWDRRGMAALLEA